MTIDHSRTRQLLEMQGFFGLDDDRLEAADFASRIAPALCSTWTAVAAALASPAALAALIPFAALGAILRSHPFDLLYNHGLRHVLREPKLPHSGPPRRFASAVATVWLCLTAGAFALGWEASGTMLAMVFVLTSMVPTTTGFCVPSFVWGMTFARDQAVQTVSMFTSSWMGSSPGCCANPSSSRTRGESRSGLARALTTHPPTSGLSGATR